MTSGLKLWSLWMLGTFLALVVGLAVLILAVGPTLNDAPLAILGMVIGAIFGGGLAIAQWLVIRNRVAGTRSWVPITIAVWVIFWSMNFAGLFGEGQGVIGKLIEGIGHGALLGALTGTGQWFLLRYRLQRATSWILITALSWAIGASTGDTIQAIVQTDLPLELIIAILLSSALAGAGMVWLLRQQ